MDGVSVLSSAPARLVNRREAAAYLGEHGFEVSPRTLEKLACVGGGPKFRSFGRKPLYSPADLIAWAEARCSEPDNITSRHRSVAA